MKRNITRVALIAKLLLAALCTAAFTLTRPAVIDWLLTANSTASDQLTSTAQVIHSESTADGVTIRLTGLVYDGTQLAFSYEAEVADPTQPALVLLSSDLTIAGQAVGIPHYITNTGDARLIPSPHLDVLPVRRNPFTGGGSWGQEARSTSAFPLSSVVSTPACASWVTAISAPAWSRLRMVRMPGVSLRSAVEVEMTAAWGWMVARSRSEVASSAP